MKAYLAPSLVEFRTEVDHLWPARSRASDGWLGDAAHAARVSEHNPDAKGCVHAIDLTATGAEAKTIIRAAIGHPGVWYVIHAGVIWSRTHGWKARRYDGPNPHTHHVHISILLTTEAEHAAAGWLAAHPPIEGKGPRDLRRGDHGADVKALQRALRVTQDGIFGPVTEAAVNVLKARAGLPQDGVAGWRVRDLLAHR